MADRQETLQIVIDSSRALTGSRMVQGALDAIKARAEAAVAAVEKLNAIRPMRRPDPAPGAGQASRAAEAEARSVEQAEQRKTDAVRRESAARQEALNAESRATERRADAARVLTAPRPPRTSGADAATSVPRLNLDTSGAVQHVNNLRNAFGRLEDSVVSLKGVLAGIGAGVLVRDVAQVGMAFQSLRTGLDVATGSSAKGAQEMERLRAESQRLGLNLLSTGKQYVGFTAAVAGSNVDMAKAKDTFFAVAQAMSVLGKSPEDASRAFLALAQIASRGTVQAGELKEQLGEQLPGAVNLAARAMGMSVEQLGKAMDQGQVSARAFFDTFGRAVAEKFPLTGALDGAGAAFNRLSNAFDEFKNRVSEAGFLKAAAEGAQDLARFLNGIEGRKLSEELGGMLKTAVENLVAAFKVLAENIQTVMLVVEGLIAIKLAGWVIGVVGAIGGLATSLASLGVALAGHPLLALAAALAAGVLALVQTNKGLQAVDATAKGHAKSLADIEQLHRQIASASGDEKKAAVDRAKAIVDSSRDVQAELEKELAQRRALMESEASVERRASPGGQSTFGPTQEDSRAAMYNTAQVERQIREAEERRKAAEKALGGSGAASPAADALTDQQRSTKELEKQTAEIRKQIEGQERLGRQFQSSKEAMVGVKRELEIISQTKPLEFRVSEQTKKEIADLNVRIEETQAKLRADPGNDALRGDISRMQGEVAGKQRLPEGQMLPEDVDKLRESYRQLNAARDMLSAGPILQTLRSEIELSNRMAEAHKKGTDAVQDEKDAQDARNKVLEAGIDITGRAASAIYALVAAHNRAEELEAIQLKVASQQREIDSNAMASQIQATTQGPERIAALAQFPAQVAAGNRPGPRPENLPFMMQGRKALSDLDLQAQKQLEDEVIQTRAVARQAGVGGIKSVAAAVKAGREDAIGDLRRERGYGPDAPLSAADQKIVEQRGERAGLQYRIRQQNKTGRTPQDTFGEKSRELGQSIDAQRQLASAYGGTASAVEQATRSQEIMNKVHGFSEKLTKDQKAALEGLVGTLYDVQKATKFEAAKFGLREDTKAVLELAAAHDQGVDAVNREKDAIEARRMAADLGISSDQAAVRSLEELIEKRREAAQDERIAGEVAANRRYVGSLDEVRAAYDKVGEARIRALAEAGARQDLLGQGADPESDRGRQFVASAGDRAMGDWTRESEDRIRLGQLEVEGTNRQMEAMSLFGEERLRRMAEIQKENELIAANGAATDELSQSQIRLAGDTAVSADRLSRMNDSLDQLANSMMTGNEAMRQAAYGGLMHFEDALVDIVTGAKSAREAFADMAKSIAADLARMAIRMAIIQPLAMMFGGGGGMFAANAAVMGGGMMMSQKHGGGIIGVEGGPLRAIPSFHAGGVVGREVPGLRPMPSVSSLIRYHAGGLAGNEVPAVLKKGEGVFTPGQMANLAPAGGGGATNNITVNVTAQQGMDQGAAERQGRAIARQIEQAMNDKLIKERRNGGLLSNS
jgi:tape measure domain-containing protein